jgi:hypothetical protein
LVYKVPQVNSVVQEQAVQLAYKAVQVLLDKAQLVLLEPQGQPVLQVLQDRKVYPGLRLLLEEQVLLVLLGHKVLLVLPESKVQQAKGLLVQLALKVYLVHLQVKVELVLQVQMEQLVQQAKVLLVQQGLLDRHLLLMH